MDDSPDISFTLFERATPLLVRAIFYKYLSNMNFSQLEELHNVFTSKMIKICIYIIEHGMLFRFIFLFLFLRRKVVIRSKNQYLLYSNCPLCKHLKSSFFIRILTKFLFITLQFSHYRDNWTLLLYILIVSLHIGHYF